MDLIIVVVLMVLIILFFRNFKSFIYGLAIIEIFLQILTFIKYNIKETYNIIDKYIPESILSILSKYSNGLFYQILMWTFLIFMILFLVYLIKGLFKRK